MNAPFDHLKLAPVSGWPFGTLVPLKYRAVLLDPPWTFSAGTKGRPQHYKRMSDAAIAALPLRALAHPDGAWFYVWLTAPMDGPRFWENIWPSWKAQGLRYSSLAHVWLKMLSECGEDGCFSVDDLAMAMGFTTRKSVELVKLFKIGNPKVHAHDVRDVILAKRREHSRKPDDIFARVEALVPGPYAEIFSRESREGWDCCGDELCKFDLIKAGCSA